MIVAAMETSAVSLSAIVTAAGVASTPTAPLSVPVSVTVTVSPASSSASSTMPVTSLVAVLAPAAICTLPVSAV
jgi:hypothetical protein